MDNKWIISLVGLLARNQKELIALQVADGTLRPLEYGLLLDNIDRLLQSIQSAVENPTDTNAPNNPQKRSAIIDPEPELLSTREVAGILGRSERTILRDVKNKMLEPIRKKGGYHFKKQQVEAVRHFYMK